VLFVIAGQTPKPIDPQLLRGVDGVVTLGRDAHVEPVAGTRLEHWDTDERSERGIDGIERRVRGVLDEVGVGTFA
jgi:arsenate-mycothiol transferase